MNDSHQLRKTVLTARDRLDPSAIIEKSDAIGTALLAREEIRASDTICIYVSFRSEVRTVPIINRLLADHKRVVVPLTRVREKRLDLVAIHDPQTDLVPGYCNIPEPRSDLVPANLVDAGQLDQIILPGSVFDLRGGRFGYGGGYYDRLLAQVPAAGRIALAFELQIVDRLKLADHDQLLDFVITEQRVITGDRTHR